MPTADYWIGKLRLRPHPEGGWYRESYRAAESVPRRSLPRRFGGRRSFSTAIHFLLRGGEFSAFHRLKSDEVWHFYAGASLTLHVISPAGNYRRRKVGPCPRNGESLQVVVPAGSWFAAELARPRAFALAGCTVAPGFDFADFELAEGAALRRLCPARRKLISRLSP